MRWIRGYYRLCLCALTLGLCGSLIVLTSWITLDVRGWRLSFWLSMFMVRTLLRILNVRVEAQQPEKLRRFQGFVFPNHVSYVDILVLVSVTPMRFLAKEEVRSWPVVGLIARAIGCVFVQREDRESRAEARQKLAQVEPFPPVVLFAEGKRGPGNELLPFRYGAFEIVIQGEVPFLPCLILYEPLPKAIWHRGEHVVKALWRLASYAGPVRVRVIPLEPVQPTADDDPVRLSVETRQAMTAVAEQHRRPSHFRMPDKVELG